MNEIPSDEKTEKRKSRTCHREGVLFTVAHARHRDHRPPECAEDGPGTEEFAECEILHSVLIRRPSHRTKIKSGLAKESLPRDASEQSHRSDAIFVCKANLKVHTMFACVCLKRSVKTGTAPVRRIACSTSVGRPSTPTNPSSLVDNLPNTFRLRRWAAFVL